jgi:hypothetical protein
MNENIYLDTLAKARQDGLELHPILTRKKVNGVFGMYTDKHIKKGSILASFPKKKVLKPSGKFKYPQDMAKDIRYAHTAIHELLKGKESKYCHFMAGLETKEDLKLYSVFYYNEGTLNFAEKLSPLLKARISQFNDFIETSANQICNFDSEIDQTDAVLILLNMQSRTWLNSGFLPIMDLFNHSDQKGLDRQEDKKSFYFKAKIDYKPNDQVFIRYSTKDLYQHAISYNYFDQADRHYINFGYRFIQSANTPFEVSVAKHTASKHPVKALNNTNPLRYQLINAEANFTEDGPSKQLIQYMQDNCFQTMEELSSGQCTNESFKFRMKSAIDSLIEMNNVESFSRKECPENFLRFYDLLKKENEILVSNLKWVSAL